MDFAKQDDVLASLAEVTWDLTVVDEAHKLAAYRYGEKTTRTERYKLGELLSRTSSFLLFLTATPHRGDPENFRLFLDLLEPGLFANTALMEEALKNPDHPLFLRRLKEDLRDYQGRPLFPPRNVVTVSFRLSEDEKRLYNAVTRYVEEWYDRALATDKRNVAFALLVLQRRLASSVRAARTSLERRRSRLQRLLQLGTWLVQRGTIDEDELEDLPEIERLQREQDLVEQLTAAETQEELQEEIARLDELVRLARAVEQREVETKLTELRRVMETEELQRTGEKLLIFTESRDTLEYLAERLRVWGFSVVTLHGGQSLEQRIEAEHTFRERAQVMVSTEAGGEGVNLQFCSLMVNYDIPWTPNRLEQRMGRIHRYGQRHEVHIYNLVAIDTREGAVLRALFDKLERIREALGSDRVFDVIHDVLPGRTLKELIVEAVANRRSLEAILAEIQAIPDQEAVRKAREAALEGLATRHIDFQWVLGEERRARESRLVPEYIEQFFERASRFLGVAVERRRDGLWRVTNVPFELRNVTPEFRRRYGPVLREYSRLAFDKASARQAAAVLVAPGHPLLETVIDGVLARAAEDLQRGAIFADPDGRLDGWLWFLEGEVHDGLGQVAGRRLFTVYQALDGTMTALSPGVLWDLQPCEDKAGEAAPPADAAVIDFVLDRLLEPYRQELAATRQRVAAVRRRYGLRSLEHLLAECEARLLEYEVRKAVGDALPEAELERERRRKEELQHRRVVLEEQIRRETTLSPTLPRVVGVARVLPQPAHLAGLAPDPAVEMAGMRVAIEHEVRAGRVPEDVSRENLGYDIRSTAPDGSVRCIEVKAHRTTGPVVLTPNEWVMARRLGTEYWLYVVDHALTHPVLYALQDPAASLEPEEVVGVVRYVIRDWRKVAGTP
jgi:superfamily II DNA or RNA helicase